IVEAVVVAILVAVVATLGFAQPPYAALPVGAGVGVTYASARLLDDRKRTRARLRALLASLPVLVDARRE
ncbi:MAG: hypothetical protein ACXVDD_25305, partial [Polyangia bacterium]